MGLLASVAQRQAKSDDTDSLARESRRIRLTADTFIPMASTRNTLHHPSTIVSPKSTRKCNCGPHRAAALEPSSFTRSFPRQSGRLCSVALARAATQPQNEATAGTTSPSVDERPWKDYWGNFVRAPIGYESFLIQDPQLEINGTSASDPEKWFKFTPEVGAVGKRKPLPFAFQRVLAPPSTLVSVRMERPLGITFEMDDAGRTRVVELVRNSKAAQQSAVARLGAGPSSGSFAQVGDVLRGVTATTMVWGKRTELTGDLTGSQRRVILFGADGQSWSDVQGALRSGYVADGAVELILERPGAGSTDSVWQVQTEAELELLAAMAQAKEMEKIPGVLNEADSFNVALIAIAASTLLLFVSGFN